MPLHFLDMELKIFTHWPINYPIIDIIKNFKCWKTSIQHRYLLLCFIGKIVRETLRLANCRFMCLSVHGPHVLHCYWVPLPSPRADHFSLFQCVFMCVSVPFYACWFGNIMTTKKKIKWGNVILTHCSNKCLRI